MTAEIGPRELVYENPYQQIFRVAAKFEGFQKQYYVNFYGRKAALLVVDGDKLLLVRQYRFLVNGLAWEIPGGRVEQNETPEQAAIREIVEEAGVRCGNLQPLAFAHPGLDNFENPTFLFYTKTFEKLHSVTDPQEVVECAWIPLQQAVEMVFRREIIDSMTIIGILTYHALQQQPYLVQLPEPHPI